MVFEENEERQQGSEKITQVVYLLQQIKAINKTTEKSSPEKKR